MENKLAGDKAEEKSSVTFKGGYHTASVLILISKPCYQMLEQQVQESKGLH